MSLIERLRRSYVDHGTNYVQEAADEIERLTEVAATADIILMATNETVVRLTAELTTSRYWREQEVKDLTAERDRALATSKWETDLCQQAIQSLDEVTAERDALKAALQLIAANTSPSDWPDDINAAIQGAKHGKQGDSDGMATD